MAKRKAAAGASGGGKKIKRPYQFKGRVRGPRSGEELKYIDYTYGNANISNAAAGGECDPATYLGMGVVAQGDEETNRDGRKIVLKSVYVKGQVKLLATTTVASVTGDPVGVALWLVLDKQTNGAQLDAEKVVTATTHPDLCFRNLKYSQRFQTLWSKRFYITPEVAANDSTATTVSYGMAGRDFECFKKLNIPVTFTGNAAVIANVADNSLHMIGIASAATKVQLQYGARVRFVG